MKFIDEANISVQAGHGGRGSISFRREKYVPRGGPDGGDGGKGGDVVFEATTRMSTLLDFKYQRRFEAKNGSPGMGKMKNGKAAPDLVIPVPVGTVITDRSSNDVLADMTTDKQRVIIAKSGRGGKGNTFFTTSTRQAPKFSQDGEEGESKEIHLELKLLADVGLIGEPNAGKSTFISVVSQARPKIADYPFTTLEPVLGVVGHKKANAFVVCDLPGLIEGAHQGKGMGDRFLKHAQRTRVLLHLVSLAPDETRPAIDRYRVIEKEITKYFDDSKKRKRIIVLTKSDLVDNTVVTDVLKEFKKAKIKAPLIVISAATRTNVNLVLDALVKELETNPK
ncbi:MAG: GTPase ObgE [uncultured bacterium]|nr:MAG: GTPase ObgE [uncultured bacterium]